MSDEHEGMGGSYALDPKTGKRKLVERTDDPMFPAPQPEPPAAEPAPARKLKDEI